MKTWFEMKSAACGQGVSINSILSKLVPLQTDMARLVELDCDDLRRPCDDALIERYLVSLECNNQSLEHSIAQIGLQSPLTIVNVEGDEQKYIFHGIRRFLALKNCGVRKFQAFEFILHPEQCIELPIRWIIENRSHRSLTHLEKSIFMYILTGFELHSVDSISDLAELLEIPPKVKFLTGFRNLIHLPEDVFSLLSENECSIEQALHLTESEGDFLEFLIAVLHELKINNKEFEQVIAFCTELGEMNNEPPEKTVQRYFLKEIIMDRNLNKREKTGALLKKLREKRFPRLVRHEQEFYSLIKSLKLPPEISVKPPENFEGSTLSVLLKGKSEESLDASIGALSEKLSKNILNKLFRFF